MKDKKETQIEKQIFFNLLKISESFPQYTLSQHLTHILRTKGKEKTKSYFWDSALLLQKVEQYYDELTSDLSQFADEDDD